MCSGAANPTVCPVKAVLDSGTGLSGISAGSARTLQERNLDVPIVDTMHQDHRLRVVDWRQGLVQEKTRPLWISIRTGCGPVVLSPQRFPVMPGTNDIVIIGSSMLKRLGIDVYDAVRAHARAGHYARVSGGESPNVAAARRLTLRIDALQPTGQEEVMDEVVECLAARGPDRRNAGMKCWKPP